MIRMVCSDIDGTLLNSEHCLTDRTRRAILALEARGIPFLPVSARTPAEIDSVFAGTEIRCPRIAFSGGMILDENGKVLFYRGMPKALAAEIVAFLDRRCPRIIWNLYNKDQWITKDKQSLPLQREEQAVKVRSVQGGPEDLRGDTAAKILCMGEPDEVLDAEAALLAAFPQCSIVKSDPTLLEVLPGGVNKAAALAEAGAVWGIALADIAAFGDNYNDVEMLEAAGIGILMGNAPEPLLRRFSNHAPDNDHDGLAQALVQLGLIPAME